MCYLESLTVVVLASVASPWVREVGGSPGHLEMAHSEHPRYSFDAVSISCDFHRHFTNVVSPIATDSVVILCVLPSEENRTRFLCEVTFYISCALFLAPSSSANPDVPTDQAFP